MFDFRGRASRREYALFHLGLVAFYLIVTILTGFGYALGFALLGRSHGGSLIVGFTWLGETGLFLLVLLIGHVSVSVRRLHDHGEPWHMYLITLIPLVGLVYWAILVFTRGSEGENGYGHDPRQPVPVSVGDLGTVFS